MEAKLISELRAKKKWTQKQLANELGFESPQLISNIERGVQAYPTKRIKQFKRIFGPKAASTLVDIKLKALKKKMLE